MVEKTKRALDDKYRSSIYVTDRWWNLVDKWRRAHPDLPRKNEAVILMVKEQVKSVEARKFMAAAKDAMDDTEFARIAALAKKKTTW